MRAMEQKIESISGFEVNRYRTYETDIPSQYSGLGLGSDSANGVLPQCNLTALINFMQNTAFGVEHMRDARKRKCNEGDVWRAFKAYCEAIEPVKYNYEDNNSLFDREKRFDQPNCRGRAKGFVQLLAVCGVPLEHLALVRLGAVAKEAGKKLVKVVRRDEATVNHANVCVLVTAPKPSNSPNAVKVSLANGMLHVSRTTREPFAYHYCAMVRERGRYEFYDPLFHRAYVNGMDDYFLTYEERKNLSPKPNFPECYVDVADPKNRLYLFKSDQVSKDFANSPAYKEVQTDIKVISTDDGVYLIIDNKDWCNPGDEKRDHPAIVKDVFGSRLLSAETRSVYAANRG